MNHPSKLTWFTFGVLFAGFLMMLTSFPASPGQIRVEHKKLCKEYYDGTGEFFQKYPYCLETLRENIDS